MDTGLLGACWFAGLAKRKYKTHNNHYEMPRKGSMPTRKSERLARRMVLMTSVLLTQRKKIGVGEHFQAKIPEWTGPPSDAELSCYRNDPDISKMLGSRTWPPEGEMSQTDIVVAGRGRPESCSCPYPGSYFCRQDHINAARDQLRSEIGQAFTEWKFDSVGEEVSKMWSHDDQLRFNGLERLVPSLENKSFWAIASKHFASKPRRDLVQYYMNVFLMRRVLSQCRLSLLEIDSDEDEAEEEEDEDQSDGSNSSQRFLVVKSGVDDMNVGTIFESRDATFFEDIFPMRDMHGMSSWESDPIHETPMESDEESDDESSDSDEDDNEAPTRKALASPADYWKEAVQSEMDSILANGTESTVSQPPGSWPLDENHQTDIGTSTCVGPYLLPLPNLIFLTQPHTTIHPVHATQAPTAYAAYAASAPTVREPLSHDLPSRQGLLRHG
ncbi:hypothetical protein QYE76_056434 [Lolium multiflorum]|uniref:ELM2 domain-containing protein n=1 Tax=Lolium multiflorum TaxID=4521 RepID=A0AAD8WQE9_LOLMU|nr:hypothetical protein QYE76_056434 [Lolium multiflorum]